MGAEGDREERPALVPSLFPFVPPTLYFSTASEKGERSQAGHWEARPLTPAIKPSFVGGPAVELLPAEQRRLLKWKMSTVTPNVVKHTIGRSHFKVTKSE